MVASNRISMKVPKLVRAGRFRRIDEWAEHRIKESGAPSIYDALPRMSGLKYQPESAKSPLGGRIDPHLRHVEDAEALERVARADRFLDETTISEQEDGVLRAEAAVVDSSDPDHPAPVDPTSSSPA